MIDVDTAPIQNEQRTTKHGWRSLIDPRRNGPPYLVGAAVLFNLVFLHQEASIVSMLNDSSFHEEMVRYATHQFSLGHLPIDGWFPYLGLGSPLFMHYQSLGATVVGLLGVVIGSNRAFSLSLYLLLSLWPICIYVAGRLLGLNRWQSGCAAAVSPFVTSVTGVGYEQQSYLWIGFGVWSQLIGMWALPLSWGLSTRAIRIGRGYWLATLFVTLTIASHFLTGYLTILPLVVIPLVVPSDFWRRIRRSLLIAGGAALTSAWILIPLAQFGRYAAINEFLQGTADANSYGARQVMIWLFDGSLFDSGNVLPVITITVGVGFAVAIWRWRDEEALRALIPLFLISLVLFFGRTTLGPLISVLPGSRDLFLRRFLMGVQLAGIFLAGVGACVLGTLVERIFERYRHPKAERRSEVVAFRICLLVLGLAALAPAWIGTLSTDRRDSADIRLQLASDPIQGQQVDALVTQALALGPGRFFAGMPNDNWGSNFTVGLVPVFKYLSNLDVDTVGYTLRTSSLMTDPEEYFDEYEPADYPLFGIRYLILPTGRQPSVHATLVLHVGDYALWELPGDGYLRVVETSGTINADRSDIGSQTENFIRSSDALTMPYPLIAYAGSPAAPPSLGAGGGAARERECVILDSPDMQEGEIGGVIRANQSAVVVLSASYDPGWRATVDAQPVQTEMVAPAFVAVPVGPGTHTITFRYYPPSYYPELFALVIVTLLALGILPGVLKRRRGRPRQT